MRIHWSPDMEVLDIDIPVGGSLSLTPQQQTFFGRCFWKELFYTNIFQTIMCFVLCICHLHIYVYIYSYIYVYLTFYGNVLNGKAEDDGPDHPQSHLHITIHNLWK